MKTKNFKSKKPLIIATSAEADMGAQLSAETTDWNIPVPKHAGTTLRNMDMEQYRGCGFDAIVSGFHHVLAQEVARSGNNGQKTTALTTLISYYRTGLASFLPFLSLIHSALQREVQWSDVTPILVTAYIRYLSDTGSKSTSQKNNYSNTKSAIKLCLNAGYLPQYQAPEELFPKNPYPNNGRKTKGENRLSKNELRQITTALRKELERIGAGTGPLTGNDLAICLLGIALRTGINTTPALELPVDCVQPHPLKANRRLLVSFKRRGQSTNVTSLRGSEELAVLQSVMPDVTDIIELALERNASVRERHDDPQRLWVYISQKASMQGATTELAASVLNIQSASLIKRHNLVNDDGKPLIFNISRLRKTFVNRLWELSGQDPLIAARHGHHGVKTADKHYWDAPPEAEKNFAFLGEVRVKEMMESNITDLKQSTPVAGCKDSLNGQRAPKDGSPCTEVLACFRCKSCVVTQDDLYRLFSFYWSVIEDRHTRNAKRWRKLFRHIVRLIDDDISPQFDPHVVAAMQEKAKKQRHPYWRDLTMLRMAR